VPLARKTRGKGWQSVPEAQTNDDRLVCYGCGKIHPQARLVSLSDGRQVGSYSEEFRRHCEALWVLRKKRSKRTRMEYLDGVAEKRGLKARQELREEMLRIWQSRQG
jgi:hypothetical protein